MARPKKEPKAEEEAAKGIPLQIEAKDFGPIAGGRIALKPLTLFIGPNNSGKSYAAMLIHSVFESYAPPHLPEGLPVSVRRRLFSEYDEYVDSRSLLARLPQFKKQLDGLTEGTELVVPKETGAKIVNAICEEVFQRRLSAEILRSFASPLTDLIRLGRDSFSLRIAVNSHVTELQSLRGKLEITKYPRIGARVKVKAIERPSPRATIGGAGREISIEVGGPSQGREYRKIRPFFVMGLIVRACASTLVKNVALPCHYLPAARSGILQGHRALAAGIVKKAPYAGIDRWEIPRFSGVVSDFISSVLTLPERRGPFYGLAKAFEKELIEGEIVIRSLDEYMQREIKYSFRDAEIPLHRASSTVSELAPLFLYLKYAIEPGDVLVIEEPEAHLHPKNQRILAKYLVRLVRRGLNVTMTTHSGYLIQQLSSFLLLSRVQPKSRAKRYEYDEQDFLRPNELAAYLFRYNPRTRGHRIGPVEITPDEGISDEEFARIDEALYEETIRLRRELGVTG